MMKRGIKNAKRRPGGLGQVTHAAIWAKHIQTRQVDLMTGIASAGEASEGVVSGAGGHVGRYSRGGGGGSGGGGLTRVAGGALDHVDGVVGLDLVDAQGIVVLHDTSRVDEPLPVDRDVLEVFAGELGLEVQDGRRLGHGDCVRAVRGRLDLEGDLSVTARLGGVGHSGGGGRTRYDGVGSE